MLLMLRSCTEGIANSNIKDILSKGEVYPRQLIEFVESIWGSGINKREILLRQNISVIYYIRNLNTSTTNQVITYWNLLKDTSSEHCASSSTLHKPKMYITFGHSPPK